MLVCLCMPFFHDSLECDHLVSKQAPSQFLLRDTYSSHEPTPALERKGQYSDEPLLNQLDDTCSQPETLIPTMKAVHQAAVLQPMDDPCRLGLHAHLLPSVLLPQLEAVDEAAVLQPMDDPCRLGLHAHLLLGVLLPQLEAVHQAAVLQPMDEPGSRSLQAWPASRQYTLKAPNLSLQGAGSRVLPPRISWGHLREVQRRTLRLRGTLRRCR